MGSSFKTVTMGAKLLILSLLAVTSLAASLKDDSGLSWRCPQPLANCLFNDIQTGELTDRWLGCAAQCAAHPDCEYWTYVTAPVEDRACYALAAVASGAASVGIKATNG